jgi:DNA-binding NarL/FixJ family response regulator
VSDRLSVFIVDDHDLFREGVKARVSEHFEVVGEADDADPAIDLIREREPDVVLLDVHLPGGGGQRVAREVSKTHPNVTFLALSMSSDRNDVIEVIGAGASGYLTKHASVDEVVEAVKKVATGEPVFSPQLAGITLEVFSDLEPAAFDDELGSLTAKEFEVLRLIARGNTYKEVGEVLFVSVKTVETHMRHILRKLQLANRHQLAEWARERGL